MSSQNFQQKKQTQFTPINLIHKSIQKTTAPRVIFTQTQQNQSDKQENTSKNESLHASNFRKSSKTFHQQKSFFQIPKNIKKNDLKINDKQNNHQELCQKISFLELSLKQYKSQILSLYSKMNERQKFYKQSKQNFQQQITGYQSTIISLQKELQGQNKLIQEYLQKYDSQVKQHQKCIKIINQQASIIQELNSQIKILQKTSNNAREVSVNCIKQNQDLKAQIFIERQKYQILFKDYQHLSLNFSNGIKQITDQNKKLQTKIQQLQMEIQIFQKDKQIQRLLVLEQSIDKRQKSLLQSHQHQNSIDSLKQYIPRRLNFEDDPRKTDRKIYEEKQNDKNKITQLKQVIELQKKKIQNLQNQLKAIQKRNKQLQQLMVKLMK